MMGRDRAKAKQAWLGPTVVVPDLRGLTAFEAGQVGRLAGLRMVGPDGDSLSLNRLHGQVIDQRPEVGGVVAVHAEVTVWTSGSGGDAGVREPRRPIPPTQENHSAVDLREDGTL
jgi:hypothetical protein